MESKHWLLILPILLPLFTAAISVVFWGKRRLQRLLSVAGALAHFVAAIFLWLATLDGTVLVTPLSNWAPPYGIVLVADQLGATMTLLGAMMGLAVVIYSLRAIDARREAFGYHPLLHVLLMGVCGAFLTGDLFNLYVWFEVMLLASFVLLALGGERPQLEGAIKYVALNLIASTLFLSATGLLYGLVGTLNFADLAVKLRDVPQPEIVTALSMLFLVAFGLKAGVFPLFFWLPASYHTPPSAIAALFAGLLTKVGVYVLIRTFSLVFVSDPHFTNTVLLWIGVLTMLFGVLGAVAQNDMRRILSFHIVSQIGYMIFGLALFTPLALAGAIFYVVHHIIVKTNLFLVAGVVRYLQGTSALAETGGLFRKKPVLAALFAVPALSLAGIPPLSGFFAKLAIVRAGLESEAWIATGIAVFVGLLTMFSMTKIWNEVFWKATPEDANAYAKYAVEKPMPRAMTLPILALALCTVSIGFGVGPLWNYSQRAATQILDPTIYVRAVLGDESAAKLADSIEREKLAKREAAR